MMWVILHFFCYIDGVYTIIDMATAYGTALGLAGRWHYLAVLDAGGMVPPLWRIIAGMGDCADPCLCIFFGKKKIYKISENCDLSHKLWYNYDNLECGRFFLWIVFMWRLHRLQKIRPM